MNVISKLYFILIALILSSCMTGDYDSDYKDYDVNYEYDIRGHKFVILNEYAGNDTNMLTTTINWDYNDSFFIEEKLYRIENNKPEWIVSWVGDTAKQYHNGKVIKIKDTEYHQTIKLKIDSSNYKDYLIRLGKYYNESCIVFAPYTYVDSTDSINIIEVDNADKLYLKEIK